MRLPNNVFSKAKATTPTDATAQKDKPSEQRVHQLLGQLEAELCALHPDGLDKSLLASLNHLKLEQTLTSRRKQLCAAVEVPVQAVFGRGPIPTHVRQHVKQLQEDLKNYTAPTLLDMPQEILIKIAAQVDAVAPLASTNRQLYELSRDRELLTPERLLNRTRAQVSLLASDADPRVELAQQQHRFDGWIQEIRTLPIRGLFESVLLAHTHGQTEKYRPLLVGALQHAPLPGLSVDHILANDSL